MNTYSESPVSSTSSETNTSIDVLQWEDGQLASYLVQRTVVAEKVRPALAWLYNELLDQGWSGVTHPMDLVEFVMDEFILCLVDDTLIAVTVGTPWFLNDPVVTEEFVAPVGDSPATLDAVVQAIEAIGKASGCTRMMLGTRANSRQRGLARLFERVGMTQSSIELTKEINQWDREA